MGILDKIFKSLWGKEEEPPPPPKKEEPRYEPPPSLRVERAEPVSRPEPPVERPATTPLESTQEAQRFEEPPSLEVQEEPIAEQIEEFESIEEFQPPTNLQASTQASTEEAAFAEESSSFSIFEDMVEDFDEAFDAAFNTNLSPDIATSSPSAGEVQHDEDAIQDLFANIAANYAKPVKNFVFELKRGTATKEWIDICRPALRSISRAAESMELKTAAKKMVDFDEALSLAQASEERVLGGEVRDLILSSYEELVEVLPQTFIIGDEEQQREGIIINSLLKQIPDLGRVTFEKLYGAGLTSLDTLFLAKKEDLAAATGIPLWLCERICNKFQEYREELEGTPRDVAQSGYRGRLVELVAELKKQHEGFERASADEWANPALANEKRKFRQNRQACVLQINVVLAEMGELDLVNEIQKLSFDRRIQRLEEYIQSTAGMM